MTICHSHHLGNVAARADRILPPDATSRRQAKVIKDADHGAHAGHPSKAELSVSWIRPEPSAFMT